MIPITIGVPESSLAFFKELVKSFNFKEIEPESKNELTFNISEEHKTLVLDRIKNSKPENWQKWEDVKDSFHIE